MRLTLTLTSALLALLIGLGCWLLLSGERTYGWAQSSALEYVVGIDPTLEDLAALTVTFSQYQEALSTLSQHVPGNYHVYAMTSRTGRRLTLEGGTSFPLFQELYVSGTFFGARGVMAQHGRLWREAEPEAVVLGYSLAQRIFGNPRLAVGRRVTLHTPGTTVDTEKKLIVGVLSPSFAQDPELDADNALVTPLATRLEEEQATPLHLFVRFANVPEAERVTPSMSAWARGYFGPESVAEPIDSLLEERSTFAAAVLPKLVARKTTLLTFVGLLLIGMVSTLYTQVYWSYLHFRRNLGVELTLGALRRKAVLTFAARQFSYSLAGGVAGAFGLWLLHASSMSPNRLPVSILGVAALSPTLALLILLAILTAPLFTRPILSLMRGRAPPARVRVLLYLTYGGLSLAISGGVAAAQVYLQLRAEADTLEAHFAPLYALQTGAAVIDFRLERAFETPRTALPVFEEGDAEALLALPGVNRASLAQAFPYTGVKHKNYERPLWAAVADHAYLEVMGLELSQGDLSSCILDRRVAGELNVGVGERLELTGARGSTSCLISGLLEPPPALWAWLVADMPEVILPPGIGLLLADQATAPFRSSRILLELSSPEAVQEVWEWLENEQLGTRAELLPYVPDAQALLADLRHQAQLFLLTALLAAGLSLAGIFNGGLLFLRLGRARIALDRALGMPTLYLIRAWWLQVLGLGTLSTVLGWCIGYVSTVRLYNALTLDIPGLPERETVVFSSLLVLVAVILLLTFTGFTLMATYWLKRQSPSAGLREGTVDSAK